MEPRARICVSHKVRGTLIPRWQLFERSASYTDLNGYAQFLARTIRASLPRRVIMPIGTRIALIMHGGWEVDCAVCASGIKDVAWLSDAGGRSRPGRVPVEKCMSEE